MQALREAYFTPNHFDQEVSQLQSEIESFHIRKREWAAERIESVLIVTDMQNYFLSPESHAFIPAAKAILPNIVKLIEFFRKHNRPVIFTRHVNNLENAGCMAWWWNDLSGENSRYSSLHEAINPEGNIVLIKHQYDAFHDTGLESILQSMQVRYPVICGVMANLCCETTTRSAFVRGFRPVLPLDATAAYNRQYHLATFRNLVFGFAPLLSTDEVIHTLQL